MATAALFLGQDRTEPASGGSASRSPFTPPVTLQQLLSDESEAEHDAELPFAVHDSASTTAHYLEPILQDLGLQQWQLHGGCDAAAALDSLHALLRLHQQLQASREVLQDELQRAKVDVKTADKTIQRLQSQSEQKAQEAGGLNIKLRQLDAWYREEMQRWTCEREELVKKCVQLEQRHVQFQHELRRRDGDFERLQKQLAALLSGRTERRSSSSSGGGKVGGASGAAAAAMAGRLTTSSRGNGFCSTSSIKRSSSGNSGTAALDTKRATKAELEELHRRVIEAYEADKQELQQEVGALRQTLQKLEREHRDLLNSSEARSSAARTAAGTCSDNAHGSGSSAGSSSSLADPLAAFQSMQAQLAALQVRKQRITGGGTSSLQQLPEAQSAGERLLLVKLMEATQIIDEQEQALAQLLKAAAQWQGHST